MRKLLVALGSICLVVGIGLMLNHQPFPAAIWLLVNGLALTLGVIFERIRYKPQLPQRPGPGWEATGERFVDPATGRLVEVYCRRSDGERLYVEVDGDARQ